MEGFFSTSLVTIGFWRRTLLLGVVVVTERDLLELLVLWSWRFCFHYTFLDLMKSYVGIDKFSVFSTSQVFNVECARLLGSSLVYSSLHSSPTPISLTRDYIWPHTFFEHSLNPHRSNFVEYVLGLLLNIRMNGTLLQPPHTSSWRDA
jgi:hypothetical protein